MSKRHPEGTYIPLYWEYDDGTEPEYVAGHVSVAVFEMEANRYTGSEGRRVVPGTFRHGWMRWVPTRGNSSFDMKVQFTGTPERGTMAVTEARLE